MHRNSPASSFELFLLEIDETLLDRVFSSLSLSTLFLVRQLSFRLYCLFRAYRLAAWNPSKHFDSWFPDCDAFMRTLRKANGVILGTQVYRFFQRSPDLSEKMSIVCNPFGVPVLGNWLVSQGYEYFQSDGMSGDLLLDAQTINKRFHDARTLHLTNKLLAHSTGFAIGDLSFDNGISTIGITVVGTDPVEHVFRVSNCEWIILAYEPTLTRNVAAMMNFMTWNEAVSLYPHATFIEKRALLACGSELLDATLSDDQSSRELTLVDAHKGREAIPYISRVRYIGDSESWCMRFGSEHSK